MENIRIRVSNSNPKTNRKVDHSIGFRNNLGSSCKSCQMMTSVAVVLFYADSIIFSDNVAFRRQDFCESVPVVCEKHTIPTMLYFVVKSPECRGIATSKNPRDRFPRITVYSFYEPKFVFFEPMKCHISSNSISSTVSLTVGSSMLFAYALIHLYT